MAANCTFLFYFLVLLLISFFFNLHHRLVFVSVSNQSKHSSNCLLNNGNDCKAFPGSLTLAQLPHRFWKAANSRSCCLSLGLHRSIRQVAASPGLASRQRDVAQWPGVDPRLEHHNHGPECACKRRGRRRVKHTYLAQGIPWSRRRFPQGEAFPLHYGLADPCDHPKCGWLGCVIFVSGGLRSRYPLIINNQRRKKERKNHHVVFILFIFCINSFMSLLSTGSSTVSSCSPSASVSHCCESPCRHT